MATTHTSTEAAAQEPIPALPGGAPPEGPDREFTVKARSQRQQIVRHFLHNKVGMSGLIIFVLMLLFGFVGPFIHTVPYGLLNPNAQSVPPGTQGYVMGSDAIGRDLMAGLMEGV